MSTPQINWRLTLPILGSLIVHACLFLSVAMITKPESKTRDVYRIALRESVIARAPKQSTPSRPVVPAKGAPPARADIQSKSRASREFVIASVAQQSMPSISASESGLVSVARNDGQILDLSASAAPDNIVITEYTSRARELGIEGDVVFDLTVGTDGRVQEAEVIKRLGYGLDQNALSAILQSTFHAAKDSHGNAITGRVIYKYTFKIANL